MKKSTHNFKFTNKDSLIRKTSWKFHMHYVNTALNFLANSFGKNKVCCYWIIIFLCNKSKKVNQLVLFLKNEKLKKLAVALKLYTYCFKFKFECFLLVLFAFKDPSTLYKSSKTRNHLKPGNLGALFLLSALQMPIKSVIGYQA